jgi:hypothetical protein
MIDGHNSKVTFSISNSSNNSSDDENLTPNITSNTNHLANSLENLKKMITFDETSIIHEQAESQASDSYLDL